MTNNIPDVIYVDVSGSLDDVIFTALYPEEESSLIKVDINYGN